MKRMVLLILGLAAVVSVSAGEPTSVADRGRDTSAVKRGKAALEQTAFIRAFWPGFTYDEAWKAWGVKEKPADYDAAFRERYGLHPAPYENDGLPMGLRRTDYLLTKGIGIDCMTCHGGSIMGKSYTGMGNSSLDIQAIIEELSRVARTPIKLPFTFCQVRGTSEAGAFSVYLLGMRQDDLTFAVPFRKLGLHDDAVEDVPAWWLLKKKRTMYYTGATDARSVRSLMQFMMHPLTLPDDFHRAEADFRDIQKYLLSMEAPKYPFAIDQPLAQRGKAVFTQHCARCHGTYGEKWTYPNKIIALDEIGTDRKRFANIGEKFGEAYNASWFAKERTEKWWRAGYPVAPTRGYQAPPLDGIWATAPYFHNASVPTLEGVLNSKARPSRFTRSYRTNEEDYDKERVGWKVREVEPPAVSMPAIEKRKIYDTTLPGRGNQGHTFGDDLRDDDRRAVIEYLKTV